MRQLFRILSGIMLFGAAGCHPFACTHPADLGGQRIMVGGTAPAASVESFVDEDGIPHIFGESETDVAYAQGFFHAKDRLWQIVTQRAGIFGRLTEILGEDSLESDRQARMIVYKIEEQFANISERDRALLDAYAQGVNAGAAYVGPTAEMRLLGVDFEPYEAIHALGIARFFGWALSTGMYSEIARDIVRNYPMDESARAALLEGVDSLGAPVVRAEEHSGELMPRPLQPEALAPYSGSASIHGPIRRAPIQRKKTYFEELSQLMLQRGSSNVWAVSGEHTESGHAQLAHDPHLRHSAPGLFYVVDLETEEFKVTGGSVPGAPGVLIGHGRHVAWGTPVSTVDVQDLVRIAPFDGRDDLYLLDGQPREYETVVQEYRLHPDDEEPLFKEEWKVTVFGPVLSDVWTFLTGGQQYALMWPGHDPLSDEGRIVSSLMDLGKATNVEEATAAVQGLTSPAITIAMAFTDGTIAYRLSGDIPVRISDEPVGYPRDGRFSKAGWSGFLPAEMKPQLTNPARGYLVAANQPVVDPDGPQAHIIGQDGSSAYRARRINDRLEALLENGTASRQDIFDIQQDVTSAEAQVLAPILARHCPESVPNVDAAILDTLCTALMEFDGTFDVDSQGAVVYTRVLYELSEMILDLHAPTAWFALGSGAFSSATYRAIVAEDQGMASPLFDFPFTEGHDGLAPFYADVIPRVLESIVADYGSDPANWRWGNMHTFSARSAGLSAVPVVGLLWTNPPTEQSGCRTCVRAERGDVETHDIISGAVFRIDAEMSTPPDVGVIMQTGQSGHFGHRHSFDFHERWSRGETIKAAQTKEQAGAGAVESVIFDPNPAPVVLGDSQ